MRPLAVDVDRDVSALVHIVVVCRLIFHSVMIFKTVDQGKCGSFQRRINLWIPLQNPAMNAKLFPAFSGSVTSMVQFLVDDKCQKRKRMQENELVRITWLKVRSQNVCILQKNQHE